MWTKHSFIIALHEPSDSKSAQLLGLSLNEVELKWHDIGDGIFCEYYTLNSMNNLKRAIKSLQLF